MRYRSSPEDKIEISVIIPSFNSKDTISNCLDSIFSQNVDFPFEVIVIDSSNDNTRNILKSYLPHITYQHFNKRVYPGKARNIGAALAKGEILAFIDTDCTAGKKWLKNIYNKLNGSKLNVVCGSVNNGYPSHLIATAEYLMEFGEFMPERPDGCVHMAPSCNLAIKKEVFDKVNGFSHVITGEDLLFSHMLIKKNVSLDFDPSIQVTHYNRRKMKKFLTKQKELGIGSFIVRRMTDVKGHHLAKYKFLSIFLPFVRMTFILYKVLKIQKKFNMYLITTFPFIILGILAYCQGFWFANTYPSEMNMD